MSPQPVRLGVITRPHGVRGAVRVRLDNPLSDILRPGLEVLLDDGRTLTVQGVFGQGDRVSFDGVGGRDAADALRGRVISVPRDVLPPPDDDEVYLVDVIGAEVRRESGEVLGTVTRFWDNGAHPIADVKTASGIVAMPFVPAMLVDVDVEAGRVVVAPPEGLFDADDDGDDDRDGP